MSRYMQVLGLGDRRPVESEERYIADWMDKGFPPGDGGTGLRQDGVL